MTIRIFMDAQFGSCGKGAVISALSARQSVAAVVRAGGPQAGHSMLGPCPANCKDHDLTNLTNNHVWKMRQIPANWHTNGVALISRGAMVNLDVLKAEIEAIESIDRPTQICVDEEAFVVEPEHIEQEEAASFGKAGSTREGVGAARAAMLQRKALRIKDLPLGTEELSWLSPYIGSFTQMIAGMARNGNDIWIEGTQGFGLSLRASGLYPFVTSWDITPQQLLADVGLHWKDSDVKTTMLVRTYPIRIAGNSGPLKDITWESIGKEPEYTTVTNKERRIGAFDIEQVKRAVRECQPDEFIVTFLDYLPDHESQRRFIIDLERFTGVPVVAGSVGFEDIRDRTEWD